MRLSEFYKRQKRTFSFEFFPPKTGEGEEKLFETVRQLNALEPSFISVTYGAMGTTSDNTLRIVTKIKNEIGLETAAHLTCVAESKTGIEALLRELRNRGIENIVALRGDPPVGQKTFRPRPDGFLHASELVRFIRGHPLFRYDFCLAVGGYPEGHRECPDKAEDLEHLKIKVDQGADLVITQLFFDNGDYFDFVDRAVKKGIKVPIIPGIMPVTHGSQIEKFSTMCGAKIPQAMREAIVRFGEDQPSVEAYGIDYATRQCEELLRQKVPGIHFYTLNKSYATRQIYVHLGLKNSSR